MIYDDDGDDDDDDDDHDVYVLIVFLGGSCNPTTWRSDIAIPFFKQHNITYYNPVCTQVFSYDMTTQSTAGARTHTHVHLM